MRIVTCMAFILRKVWSWKRIEAFPGLGIALSLVTVLIYQVYVSDLFKRKINESPTSSTNQQFAVWQCCCKEDDGKHICDGLLEGGLSRSSGLKKKKLAEIQEFIFACRAYTEYKKLWTIKSKNVDIKNFAK